MEIRFIQTADPFRYREMLGASSRTVAAYCQKQGFEYESFIGLKRGSFPWHATFNRIPMLHEFIKQGYRGWIIYLDADAFIVDLDFDLRSYLEKHRDNAAVMVSSGGGLEWAVNAGVFMINVADDRGMKIIERWSRKFGSISDEQLATMDIWDDGCSDQSMLFEVLDEDEDLRSAIYYESTTLINGDHASFIRQILRAYYPSLELRIEAVKLAVADVMGDQSGRMEQIAAVMVSAFYRSILRRDPDEDGLRHFSEEFHKHGVEAGIRKTLDSMLNSPEYRALSR